MKKKQVITAGILVSALALTGLYGVSSVRAAETDTNFSPVVQKLVEKYNLNKDEVKVVMNEERASHQAERKVEFSARLDALVTSGKITTEQKAGIIAKHDELNAKREALRDQNHERGAMHTQMQAIRTEMSDYLKSIGLDESILPEKGSRGKGMGGFGQGGREMHRGNQNQAS